MDANVTPRSADADEDIIKAFPIRDVDDSHKLPPEKVCSLTAAVTAQKDATVSVMLTLPVTGEFLPPRRRDSAKEMAFV